MQSIQALPDVETLYAALKAEFTPVQWRTWESTLGLFLTAETAKHLKNVPGVSASTISRLLSRFEGVRQLEPQRLRFQAEALRRHAHRLRGKKPWMVIRVDLTSIPKTGQQLPYLRTYNGVHGIHLVVIHVSIGKLSFPMGHLIYDPDRDETPIQLALRLIQPFHPYHWGGLPQFVVMDSGFYSADALDLLRWWGFEHISFGARRNFRLRDGRRLGDAGRGEAVELETLPGVMLYTSWVELPRQGGKRRFYVLDTQPGTARTLSARHKRRWLIESLFKSAKHDFGLNETRLRTKTGIANWLFLVFLSTALALYGQMQAGLTTWRSPRWVLTLSEAALRVRDLVMPHVVERGLMVQWLTLKEGQSPTRAANLGFAA